jgi:protein SCO1/2
MLLAIPHRLLSALCLALVLTSAKAAAQIAVTPAELDGVDVTEQLDKPLPKDAVFRDHTGKQVHLGDYFDGRRPVVLTLAYHGCQVVCSMVLGATLETLKEQAWTLGNEFRAVTISIDPRDTPQVAAKKRSQLMDLYGREKAGWDFLVGDEANIRKVANAVGFKYRYDARQDQYAHPAVLMLTKPNGDMARYLYGLEFDPKDVRIGLLEASQGKSISTIEKAILFCYMYDPIGAKYVVVARNVMKLGGAITVVVLAMFLGAMWRRERRNRRRPEAPGQSSSNPTTSIIDPNATATPRARA